MAGLNKIVILVILVPFSFSCAEEDKPQSDTLEYFEKYLRKDMTHESLLETFGGPEKDLGSGIHIYVYTLEDSTEVWIGITNVILYANHMDKDQHLLKELI
jgi:hypothetical protein